MAITALQAFKRFGFERRGSEPVPDDINRWLTSQLTGPDPLLAQSGPSTKNFAMVMRRDDEAAKSHLPLPVGFADLFQQDVTDALYHAASTDLPFRERLVWFWTNHFTVSGRAGGWIFGLAGAVHARSDPAERDRAFSGLLKAVMRHPAMLWYLDN